MQEGWLCFLEPILETASNNGKFYKNCFLLLTEICFIYLGVFPNIFFSLNKFFISEAVEYIPICKVCFTQEDALEMSLMVCDNAYHRMAYDASN